MGHDDIPVGLRDVFAMNQSDSFSPVGDCKYAKAIPHRSNLDHGSIQSLFRAETDYSRLPGLNHNRIFKSLGRFDSRPVHGWF